MEVTARALVATGKGILAADESLPTISKRFQKIKLSSTEKTRQAYREMLLSTPGLGQFISGVILFDETIRQQDSHGTPLVEVLHQQGIIPGIKVDHGTVPLAKFPNEKITEGLDGLRERFAEYKQLKAAFSKWRAVFKVSDAIPTLTCIKANAHNLARFAALSQEAGIVPIVEPEVLMDGGHTIERAEQVTEAVLYYVFDALGEQRVIPQQMLLKASMVLPGKDCLDQSSVDDVAYRTVRCLRRAVPAAVPGIVFLSGGQSPEAAAEHLNAMQKLGPHPWELSFSFGRALQDPALPAWHGTDVHAGQQALHRRAHLASLARTGAYTKALETEEQPAEDTLHQAAA